MISLLALCLVFVNGHGHREQMDLTGGQVSESSELCKDRLMCEKSQGGCCTWN